ncbi:Sel1 repeat protein [Candidatus Bealeia paramacronuclearis]|uniref:Sel1 repeat protein n=1 Tax=Candidatus Bealeia paramacronuclearis TaxID=1921001 RepID=A0ABZ2C621_9PROT|nr:Sel1 repeat protein [Candidatus Bealeia paramacronuclearis]
MILKASLKATVSAFVLLSSILNVPVIYASGKPSPNKEEQTTPSKQKFKSATEEKNEALDYVLKPFPTGTNLENWEFALFKAEETTTRKEGLGSLSELSDEVILNILKYLTYNDLLTMRSVSKTYGEFATYPYQKTLQDNIEKLRHWKPVPMNGPFMMQHSKDEKLLHFFLSTSPFHMLMLHHILAEECPLSANIRDIYCPNIEKFNPKRAENYSKGVVATEVTDKLKAITTYMRELQLEKIWGNNSKLYNIYRNLYKIWMHYIPLDDTPMLSTAFYLKSIVQAVQQTGVSGSRNRINNPPSNGEESNSALDEVNKEILYIPDNFLEDIIKKIKFGFETTALEKLHEYESELADIENTPRFKQRLRIARLLGRSDFFLNQMLALNFVCGLKYFDAKKYEEAFPLLKKVAQYPDTFNQGRDATAQLRLSIMYKNGWGVSQSSNIAFKWLLKSEKSITSSNHTNNSKSLEVILSEKAGLYKLFMQENNFSQSFNFLTSITKKCNPKDAQTRWAQFSLAHHHAQGLGTKQDFKKALELLKRLEDNNALNSKITQEEISILQQFKGKTEMNFCEKDPIQAYEYFYFLAQESKLSPKGDPRAQYLLGLMYKTGALKTNNDLKAADYWFQKAKTNGNTDAQKEIDTISKLFKPEPTV